MKLFRYGQPGQEKPGILIDEIKYDISAFISNYDEAFFETDGLKRVADLVKQKPEGLVRLNGDVRLGSAVARPSKIVCVGLNYKDHAAEVGAALPKEPVIFIKSNSALNGPYDDIVIPQGSEKTDWETEFAMVIGKKASYLKEEQVKDYLAGYVLHNDVSERAFMFERNGTWDKGKGCDTFAPIGPYLVTTDEIPDTGNLHVWMSLNGKLMQNGTTADMIFNPFYLVAYITQFMTLYPGDVVSTGSPAGSGAGFKPPVFLKPGDLVECGIDGLGSQRQRVKAYTGV
ncbi:fumarylacetoacetate hydrolase family protein [Mucilaginibacter sp. RS28]|uniref:Fumarylacetoacetate hydrolase family protein n=1 Tax=Mucilaginibacter straminoryzae TaxID=2932774 RepID=A0A9X2BB11_9SPHI|nr:fumarylacetoacetate hydrolase family protein [Mucilaginibacter straminoryzae]MCJ8211951.1 fumarylacetoacetate hydrolase family protein [Mucilaginibacter straminoryzae]